MGVDNWNDAAETTDGAGWKPDTSAPVNDGWQPDGTGATDDNFTGEFSPENISKHAGGAHDGGCRNCGEDGHFARDCPNERVGGGGLTGACYNCGEVGHNKVDCPNPRVEREFTGECRSCGQTGHRAADCPSKPPATCKICCQEGHLQAECGVNRITLGVSEMSVEDAWTALELADKEKEVEDIRKAILGYAKAFPALTFEELEAAFRESGMNTYLIAKEQQVSDTHTIVNLQGKTDQKYTVSIQFSAKPKRTRFSEGWPSSSEENLARLTEAGFPMDRFVQKCGNCGELGHGSKKCPEERREFEKTVIKCSNCAEEGHRVRDCPKPRQTRGGRACRNCGEDGHISKDCEKPRSAENVECKNCGQMGHFSRDCPDKAPEICRNCGQEGHRKNDCVNERVMQCRNCDEWGSHTSRDCPKPKDWSRVKCSGCEQMGHGAKRCPNPPAEPEAGDAVGAGGDWDDGAANTSAPTGGDGGW